MIVFQTSCGNVGRSLCKSESSPTEWLIPDCLNVFQWSADCFPDRRVDWTTVREIQLSEIGFTEISSDIYMKTNELQHRRNEHDPVVAEMASEHAMFTRAQSNNRFVHDVHLAVLNWPEYIPPNSMGRRLWETINRISQRAALDEDNKRFLNASDASTRMK